MIVLKLILRIKNIFTKVINEIYKLEEVGTKRFRDQTKTKKKKAYRRRKVGEGDDESKNRGAAIIFQLAAMHK